MAGKRKRLVPGATPRRVVVALRMAGIAGQDKLNGIFDYLSAGRRWQLIIYRTKHEFSAEVVEHEIARGADAHAAAKSGNSKFFMGGILPKRRPPLQDGLALNDLKKTLKGREKNIFGSSKDLVRQRI